MCEGLLKLLVILLSHCLSGVLYLVAIYYWYSVGINLYLVWGCVLIYLLAAFVSFLFKVVDFIFDDEYTFKELIMFILKYDFAILYVPCKLLALIFIGVGKAIKWAWNAVKRAVKYCKEYISYSAYIERTKRL